MFFKPGTDVPLYGNVENLKESTRDYSVQFNHLDRLTAPNSGSSVKFGDGTYLSPTPKSLKIFSEDFGPPLVRLDFKSNHGLPENHLQFGRKTYTERYGEEAKDIFSHIVLKKVSVDLFGE
ncbi:MAG TPA: hypothetical protein VJA20_03090 [Candidatus Nanoarchaeia archaeon]|nr:hypothetical protein [Candidatus Nanoarchaeia archaeon]